MGEHLSLLVFRVSGPNSNLRWKTIATFGALGFVVLVGHWAFTVFAPVPKISGDEKHYLRVSYSNALSGETSLRPGRQAFSHRPELITRVYSKAIEPSTPVAEQFPELFPTLSRINLIAFLGVLVCVVLQCLELGLGARGALISCGILATLPTFGFYVHVLRPEMLHSMLVGIAFVCLLRFLRTCRRFWLLALAGAAIGYALLLKGVMNGFLPISALFLCTATFIARRTLPLRKRVIAAACAGIVFSGCSAAIVIPQLVTNKLAGHGYVLAANRWRNIEWGLRMPLAGDTPALQEMAWAKHKELYFAPEGLVVRDLEAKRRVLELLGELRVTTVLTQQVRKLWSLLIDAESYLDFALGKGERWGDPAPGWIQSLAKPSRILWNCLLILSCVGLVLTARKSAAHMFLATFCMYYFAGLLACPTSRRFAIQLVPTLCILAAAGIEHISRRLEEYRPSAGRRHAL